jgi:hypothetical protein
MGIASGCGFDFKQAAGVKLTEIATAMSLRVFETGLDYSVWDGPDVKDVCSLSL